MKVNVRTLTGRSAPETLEFSGEIDLSSIKYWGFHPFSIPVAVKGKIKHLGHNRFDLKYQVTYTLTAECARCLEEVNLEHTEEFTHELRESDQDPFTEDMFIPVNEGILEVDHMVSTDLLLNIDDVILCSPDCKGICPVCGGDRNTLDCGCSVKLPDPRFDKLRELLDKSPK